MVPTIGLGILVRDEADNVRHAIEQTLPVVDHVTVVDTGSTDDTIAIAKKTLKGVPHLIEEREWRGFGPNRTELIELARPHADYTLMLDADHTLHVNGDQPELTADAYMLPIRGAADSWRLPLLTRNDHPFEYRGAAHSYLASDVPYSEAHTDWLAIDGGGGVTRGKLERDLGLLLAAFASDPNDTRTVHYLAQTYRDLDMPTEAIRFYRLRAEMDGFVEERYWARYQLGCLLGENVSFADGADELLKAWRERPSRIEALRALANLANSVADKCPLPEDVLFVRQNDYRQEAA